VRQNANDNHYYFIVNDNHYQLKAKDMKFKIIIAVIAYFTSFMLSLSQASEVNIFSARHYDSDVQLYEKFTNKTGVKVNVISGKSGALEKRIIEEGSDSKADLYITADAGRLGAFDTKGMLQSGLNTPAIKAAVPNNFRTSKWTGIAKRARIVYFAPERVTGAELAGLTYESLADPKWKGRIVIRSSNNIYNQSLVASLVKNNGKVATAEWSKGIVSNMSRSPKGNDRAQILAVAAGEADLAIANTYYLALMLAGKKGPEQQAAAKKVKPFFPNQNDRGTHMNISGVGLVKGAPNKANAIKLVEFLLSEEAQTHIVNNTFEYPMIAGVLPHPLVVNMGLDFKQDLKTKVVNFGKKQADALEVMTAAGWK